MKCPRCGSGLAAVQLENIQLDKCHDCDGIWLDDGELNSLVEDRQQLQKSESVVQRIFSKLSKLFD